MFCWEREAQGGGLVSCLPFPSPWSSVSPLWSSLARQLRIPKLEMCETTVRLALKVTLGACAPLSWVLTPQAVTPRTSGPSCLWRHLRLWASLGGRGRWRARGLVETGLQRGGIRWSTGGSQRAGGAAPAPEVASLCAVAVLVPDSATCAGQAACPGRGAEQTAAVAAGFQEAFS